MRNKISSSLQKTYDECYLICSTAVYFEGQGNEAEALRSWRSALDQIYYHNAYRVPANYRPRSETEKALQDSLRDMELQCKERVDLLEALKLSRLEDKTGEDVKGPTPKSSNGKLSKAGPKSPRQSSDSDRAERGYIGGGSIAAVGMPDLSRPGPPLPQRPTTVTRNTSERAVVGRNISSSSAVPVPSLTASSPVGPTLAPPNTQPSRSPSPEKGRTMRTTLRSGGREDKRTTMRTSRPSGLKPPVPSKAATLAWSAGGRPVRDRLGRSLDPDTTNSTSTLDGSRKYSHTGLPDRPRSSHQDVYYDSTTRTLVTERPKPASSPDLLIGKGDLYNLNGRNNGYPFPPTDPGQPGAVAGSMLTPSTLHDLIDLGPQTPTIESEAADQTHRTESYPSPLPKSAGFGPVSYPTYLKEYPETTARKDNAAIQNVMPIRRRSPARAQISSEARRAQKKPVANSSSPRHGDRQLIRDEQRRAERRNIKKSREGNMSPQIIDDDTNGSESPVSKSKKRPLKQKQREDPILADPSTITSSDDSDSTGPDGKDAWEQKVALLMKHLPKGVDEAAAKQIFNEIVVKGDEVHWDDVAGLEVAKNALKEAVVYPFLRPDLFMGLREPARGMLLFGPPGTGKTMLARAVATESRSTFFSISASSLTSKYLGESEKLVRALFSLAKALAPSIIFVDEIDSLLSSRSGSGEHEATRRIKTEFLIQWSDLQRAAAGREQTEKEKERGDASRVLVLAATNLPWAIDEAARRRFVRRQYIPLPEDETRAKQLRTLLGHQKHSLNDEDIEALVKLAEGFSGSDITALAKDAAMGPLRSLGEALLHMSMDEIRPIQFKDFQASLINIRPSVSKQGLKEFEDWAKEFGERGG
ncbi:MAG: hypothetical protein M1818_003204 [Claussenomyces sp. TS43310]|nr:MAG: hypothetical protein M1818_003204 [Claussenomyces sp. TS43310]